MIFLVDWRRPPLCDDVDVCLKLRRYQMKVLSLCTTAQLSAYSHFVYDTVAIKYLFIDIGT